VTTVPPFDYELAPDLGAALTALANGATPVHGGTELLPAMSLGLLAPQRLVSIRNLDELRLCRRHGDQLQLGAGLTHHDVGVSALVRDGAPLLAEVTSDVGNIRVRCTGTLGGNLAFAEPRSDLTTALIALDAHVLLADTRHQRELAVSDFLLGPYETDLRPEELITSITVPFAGTDFGVYRKVVFSERPVVGVALTHLKRRCWRLVVGAVGLTPTIVDAARLDEFDPVAIAEDIETTRDLGGGEAYKRHLAVVTIERCRDAATRQESTQ
jgi:aerobic carbon-monoxide dehydrogenase medium subunit